MTNKLVLGLVSITALAIGMSARVNAAEPRVAVPQLTAITTDLGHNTSALTYWVDEADGIHVVTTIDTVIGDETAPEHGRDAVVRFSALILPGQSQIISVPGPVGSQPQVLRIRRLGNHFNAVDVEVDRVAVPTMAAESAHATN